MDGSKGTETSEVFHSGVVVCAAGPFAVFNTSYARNLRGLGIKMCRPEKNDGCRR